MLISRCISDRMEMVGILTNLREMAQHSRCGIGFQYMDLPLMWFDHFNSLDGMTYEKRRGRYFLGAQSRLVKLHLLTVECQGRMVGAVPLASMESRIPGGSRPYQILTFPGDPVLVPYCDFLVREELTCDVVDSLFREIDLLLREHDILFLGCIPHDSPNIKHIERKCRDLCTEGREGYSAHMGRRGGLFSWNIGSLKNAGESILLKCTKGGLPLNGIATLERLLEAVNSGGSLFAGTRRRMEGEIEQFVSANSSVVEVQPEITQISSLLRSDPIEYRFIALPGSTADYWQSLSRKSRRDFNYDRNKFKTNGGVVERIESRVVQESHIERCLALHQMRWGAESAMLMGESKTFVHAFFMKCADQGKLTLYFANVDNTSIASLACIDYSARREAVISGRDMRYGHLSAGVLLFLESIYDAIELGFVIYDFGGVAFEYKKKFAPSHRFLNSFVLFQEGIRYSSIDHLFMGFECLADNPEPLHVQ